MSTMKGCLKLPSPIPSPALPDCLHSRKCVAFEAEGTEQVFFADEWDRTPTEPTRRLSYQDLMELKEIQCSLPLANQPPDPVTGRPGRHYLSNVPISLLPLLPSSDSAGQGHGNGVSALNGVNGHYSDGHGSPNHNGHLGVPGCHSTNGTNGAMHGQGLHGSSARTTPHRNIVAGANKPRPAPPNHLAMPTPRTTNNINGNYPQISNPFAQRPKTNFAFLPLLDTPPPSAESSVSSSQSTTPSPSNLSSRSTSPDLASDTDHTDPPTPSLTNASLDSPVSCASSVVSWSPEPTFLQLPPKHLSCLNYGNEATTTDLHFGPVDSYFPVHTDESDVDVGDHMSSYRHSQFGMPLVRRPPGERKIPSSKSSQKRNVIFVNGVEIELDGDEKVKPTPAPPPAPLPVKRKNVIIVNDVEIELDGDEDEGEASTRPQCCPAPSDDALSIHCNSAENLKPPENRTGYGIKAHSSSSPSPSSSSLPSSARPLSFLCSTLPLTSYTIPGRTTLDSDTSCTRSNLGSTSAGESNTAGLGLELGPGAASGEGIGTGSKSTIDASVGSTREPSRASRMEASMGPSTGPSFTSSATSLASFSTVTGCPTAAVGAYATGFGSLHMPLRFKRHSAKANANMVSTDAVISS
ncbi:hypothetical protein JOM56_007138 [Amanita muscaria]